MNGLFALGRSSLATCSLVRAAVPAPGVQGLFLGVTHCPTGQFEDAGSPQHPRIEKLEQGPQLIRMVLDGSSTQCQAVSSVQQANGIGRFGIRVLESLGLVEDNVA